VSKSKFVSVINIVLVFIAITFVFLIVYSLNWNQKPSSNSTKHQITLLVGEMEILAEVADTEEKITQGLSGRDSLKENEGMYFILGEKKSVTFWMKGMQFPIDIIWIDSGEIIGIVKNAPIPKGNITPTFSSPSPVTHVLEINAGLTSKYNIQAGDSVTVVR
jgi:uncharacterized membrane protein (UPF0127 family)